MRNGNVFTSYESANGVTWTQQGTATFTMSTTALVGLAVTSHNISGAATAAFDNVTTTGWPALPATTGGLTAIAGNAQVALSWAAASGAASYNLQSATNDGGPYAIFTNVVTTNYLNTGLLNGTTYYYVVSSLNIAGESTNSAPASATPQLPPPLTLSMTSTNLVFSWPLESGFSLQSSTNLASGSWVTVTSAVSQMVSNQWQVALPPSTNAGPMFYRLMN